MTARSCGFLPDSIPERSATSWPCWRDADAELAPDRADLPLFRRDRHAKRLRLARPPGRVLPDARSVVGASFRLQESTWRSDQDPLLGQGWPGSLVQEARVRLPPSSRLYRNRRTPP